MTLWRRAPREVYRVYGEDEYLADEASTMEGLSGAFATDVEDRQRSDVPAAATATARSHGSHPGRLMGLGLLVGVSAGALVLVALNIAHRSATEQYHRAPGDAPARIHATTTRPVAGAGASSSTTAAIQISSGSAVERSRGRLSWSSHVSARPSSLARRRKSTSFTARALPRQPTSMLELPSPEEAVSPTADEFGFER